MCFSEGIVQGGTVRTVSEEEKARKRKRESEKARKRESEKARKLQIPRYSLCCVNK